MFFKHFKWYRKLCGGVWHYVRVDIIADDPEESGFYTYWIHDKPKTFEHILRTEVY